MRIPDELLTYISIFLYACNFLPRQITFDNLIALFKVTFSLDLMNIICFKHKSLALTTESIFILISEAAFFCLECIHISFIKNKFLIEINK